MRASNELPYLDAIANLVNRLRRQANVPLHTQYPRNFQPVVPTVSIISGSPQCKDPTKQGKQGTKRKCNNDSATEAVPAAKAEKKRNKKNKPRTLQNSKKAQSDDDFPPNALTMSQEYDLLST